MLERAEIASRYNKAFAAERALEVPTVGDHCESAWHLYILRLNLELLTINRAEMIEKLKERGIGTSVHFIPLHMHPYYRNAYGYRGGRFPGCEQGIRAVFIAADFSRNDRDANRLRDRERA